MLYVSRSGGMFKKMESRCPPLLLHPYVAGVPLKHKGPSKQR